MNDNCEHDCRYNCAGCNRTFCKIKTDEGLSHEEEMPEAHYTGHEKYCHYDCYRDSIG